MAANVPSPQNPVLPLTTTNNQPAIIQPSQFAQLMSGNASNTNFPAQNILFAQSSSGHSVSGMAWAIPVAVDKLGASLQAQFECKSTIATLRSCRRAGGSDAPIAKLPLEVLSMIEGHYIGPIKAKYERKWAKDLKCIQWENLARDHFSYDRVVDVQKDLENRCGCACGCGQLSETNPVGQYMHDSEERWALQRAGILRMMGRVDSMPAITSGPHTRPEGSFAKLNRLLRRYFGLETFIMDFDMTNARYNLKRSAIQAYLILPERATFISNHINHMVAGSSMASFFPVSQPLINTPLSEEEKRRFKIAMKTLGLEVHVNALILRQQVPVGVVGAGPVDTPAQRRTRAKALMSQRWPQISFLARSQARRS